MHTHAAIYVRTKVTPLHPYTRPRVVVSARVLSMGQIDLFKNDLYLIGPHAK